MTIDLRDRWSRIRNAVRGSDPGLGRLRTAVSGAGAMATALGVEYCYAQLIGAGATNTLISMLLGAIVSMMGAMALTGTELWPKVRTAVFFPFAIGGGMVLGALLSAYDTAMLVVFVAVMFVAVFIRRFGLPYFFYGFMLWMGYFFATFLHPTLDQLPALVGATAVGTAWVLLLSSTIFRTNPARTLRHVRRSFGARSRQLAGSCADLLAQSDDESATRRNRRRVHGQQHRLSESALMIEAWSADERALPSELSAQELRRRVLDWNLTVDRLTATAEALVDASAELRSAGAEALRLLARGRDDAAVAAARRLSDAAEAHGAEPGTAAWPAVRLAEGVTRFAELMTEPGQAAPPDDDDFEPAVALALGNLPGSPAVARDVDPRGHRWNPLRRLSFTSRQAVQVAIAAALAIWLGKELDATRYYWAVIAAFIAFTGTGSRSETFLKSFNRVLGTLVGLVAGIWAAELTVGDTTAMVAVIVASMFCGLYLVRVSYALMIFFVTIMVSQLYSILHEFSDHLLMLRLEETVIGAACGIAVALLVTPLSTRDTAHAAQQSLFTALADLLDAVADRADPEQPRTEPADAGEEDDDQPADPEVLVVQVADRMRQLDLVARPLTRPLLWDNSPRTTRHRLSVHTALVRTARAVAARVQPGSAPETLSSCRALARVAREFAGTPMPLNGEWSAPPDLRDALGDADTELHCPRATEPSDADRGRHRALVHLHALLAAMAGEYGAPPAPAEPPEAGRDSPSRAHRPAYAARRGVRLQHH